jgi:hypothetical protein
MQFVLNAAQIRALADYASSLRAVGGDDVWITAEMQNDGFMVMGNLPVSKGQPPSGKVFQVSTSAVSPDRPRVQYARIGTSTNQKKAIDLLGSPNGFDAVFWSEAAVEKFVIPYYASKSLWMAGHVVDVLCQKWFGVVPGVTSGPASPAEDTPFALAHLPSSDYVTIGAPGEPVSGGALGDDLILLGTDGDGNVTGTALSYYL